MTDSAESLIADPAVARRQRAHALIAKAPVARVRTLFDQVSDLPHAEPLRPTTIGLITVRGRVGGDGMRFNLGELPVARAALRLADGIVGVGYVAGRDHDHARLAALGDAMIQSPAWRERLETTVLAPLASELAVHKALEARKAAATKVEFFTMVRTRKEK